jgi:hypothetical protein
MVDYRSVGINEALYSFAEMSCLFESSNYFKKFRNSPKVTPNFVL